MSINNARFFYAIPGLLIPENGIDDKFMRNLDFFIDWVQNNVQNLSFLHNNHFNAFAFEMKMLSEILGSIYAKRLQNEAAKIITLTEVNEHSLRQSILEEFVSNMQTLAIDIQLAQNAKKVIGNNDSYDETANYRDVIGSMKIISRLLEQLNFEKAADVARTVSELKKSKYAAPFFEALAEKNIDLLKNLIEEIITLYKEKIDDVSHSSAETSSLKKLLIVDDMTDVLSLLTKMLKGHYKVFAFANGRQALNFIDKVDKPDAFLLDIEMPEMDGFELAGNIRKRSEYKDAPLLFHTANSSRNTIVKSLLYAPKAFIVKPSSKDAILAKLKEYI